MAAFSNQGPNADANEYNVALTVLQSVLAELQTVSIVRVEACTNAGGIVPAGTVDVTVLVNIMSANRTAIPHGIIANVNYNRIQGGANAVIIDPQPGDIGICLFCSRDSSVVKRTKAQANPGSFRTFDWADGLYIGGILNGAPTQYVAFTSDGIKIVSPSKITLQAPVIDIEATTSITANSPSNDIKGGGTKIDGKVFLTHDHTLVQPGGGTSGPVG